MRCLIALLFFTATAPAAPPTITVEKPSDPAKVTEITVPVGKLVRLNLDAMGDVTGASLQPTKLAEFEPGADKKSARFVAESPGRYPLVVFAGGEATWFVLVAGHAPDEPILPPRPVDPLVAKLRVAFDADTSLPAVKSKTLADLAELYRQAVGFAKSADAVSVAQVVAKVRAAATTLGITGLSDVRQAIASELAAAFPENADLDSAGREKLAATFDRIAKALAAVSTK